MRRIIERTAYDTETSELIKEVFHDPDEPEATRLYRTRHGAFFFYHRYLHAYVSADTWQQEFKLKEELTPCTDENAQEWLEKYANDLVERYFGEMPEWGSAERRFTLRMPINLAKRLETIAKTKETTVTGYINRCLERCAAEDDKAAPVV
jgi:hypothetical protein